jgi:site-specific recombinase XerD
MASQTPGNLLPTDSLRNDDARGSLSQITPMTRVADQLSTLSGAGSRTPDAELLRAYAAASAPNSLRALAADIEAFDLWCRAQGLASVPATPQQIAEYLGFRAGEGAAPASLARYKASLARAHRLLGFDDPTRHERVRLTLAAHRRKVGSQQKQAKPLRFKGAVKDPLREAPKGLSIKAVLAACDESLTELRDKALLSVAYDTGLRASELVRIDVSDIMDALDDKARLLRIRRTKGDQDGQGATAYLSPRSVRAMDAWLEAAGIGEGPVFRRVIVRRYAARASVKALRPGDLSGRAHWDRAKFIGKAGVAARTEYDVGEGALHPGSVGVLFRAMITRAVERGMVPGIEAADLPALLAGISAHSTRVGLNQDLFAVGEDIAGIMDALRWKSTKMPLLYNRNLAADAGAAGRLLSRLD